LTSSYLDLNKTCCETNIRKRRSIFLSVNEIMLFYSCKSFFFRFQRLRPRTSMSTESFTISAAHLNLFCVLEIVPDNSIHLRSSNVFGICIGCIIVKTNIHVCVVGYYVPTCFRHFCKMLDICFNILARFSVSRFMSICTRTLSYWRVHVLISYWPRNAHICSEYVVLLFLKEW